MSSWIGGWNHQINRNKRPGPFARGVLDSRRRFRYNGDETIGEKADGENGGQGALSENAGALRHPAGGDRRRLCAADGSVFAAGGRDGGACAGFDPRFERRMGHGEESYEQVLKGYTSTQLDNSTDAYMLLSAIHRSDKSAVDQAVNVYTWQDPDSFGQYGTLLRYGKSGSEGMQENATARYWLGYLVVLKPLLLFLNYMDIRMLNMIVQTGAGHADVLSDAETGAGPVCAALRPVPTVHYARRDVAVAAILHHSCWWRLPPWPCCSGNRSG
ncbi:MAG: hypothetical protein ACLUN6_03765 [Holdemanella sp.]|uniref:hypothetical protein n=1 Tax=Holdemanella sp. TaxID=1971762 RepID=UPI003992C827